MRKYLKKLAVKKYWKSKPFIKPIKKRKNSPY
jgi:hypothetical protein